MAKKYYPDEMYNLPYEQARAKYGVGVGNNIHFISKDQFELEKAKIETQKKKAAAEKAGTAEGAWAYQKGPSDEIVEKITGKTDPTHEEVMEAAKEIVDRRITPDQQGIQAKGNPYENNINIDDTRAIGATKEELDYMLQNGLISKAAYDKQIAALSTPEVQKAMDEGTKKAEEYISELSDTDSDSDDGGDDDDDEENYKKSMMSIWDAYRAGLIDKETAGYFTIDAIATLAKNLGRSIGNVGAQFSGGTIDNGHDESKWGQRQKAMLSEEIQKELEGVGSKASRQAESESLDNQAKRIRNAYTPKQLEQQIEMFKKDLEKAEIDLDIAHSRTDLIKFIKKDPNYANSPFKMGMVAYLIQNGVGGAADNASNTLLDAMNWAITLVK